MNELLEELMECLQQETRLYQQLIQTAGYQKELLIGGKTELLPDNLKKEEKIVFVLGPVVKKRNELLRKMRSIHGGGINLMELTERLDITIREKFKSIVSELLKTAKNLDVVNRLNEKLLRNASSYVNLTLEVISSKKNGKTYIASKKMKKEQKSSFVNRVI